MSRPRRLPRTTRRDAAASSTYASMPAARHCSRSPAMARAVSATIGTCPPAVRSWSRMTAVASSPLISGICTSIRTRSNDSSTARSAARRPLPTIVTRCPFCLSKADDERLVGRVVFSDQHSQRPARPPADRCVSLPRCRRDGAGVAKAVTIASSRSDCLTGLASCAANTFAARPRDGSRTRRRQQDHLQLAEAIVSRDLLREAESVNVGHQRVGQQQVKRVALFRGLSAATRARRRRCRRRRRASASSPGSRRG